jgi:hypothetical protein
MNIFESVLKEAAKTSIQKDKERSDWEAERWREFMGQVQINEQGERKRRSRKEMFEAQQAFIFMDDPSKD